MKFKSLLLCVAIFVMFWSRIARFNCNAKTCCYFMLRIFYFVLCLIVFHSVWRYLLWADQLINLHQSYSMCLPFILFLFYMMMSLRCWTCHFFVGMSLYQNLCFYFFYFFVSLNVWWYLCCVFCVFKFVVAWTIQENLNV